MELEPSIKRIVIYLRGINVFKHILPALFFGASLGFFIHAYWLIDTFPVGSKRLIFFTILACLIGIVGYILLFRWMTSVFHDLSKLQIAGIIGASLLAGSFLFFTVTGNWQRPARYISLFLPTHTLEISIPDGQDAGDVSILWLTTSLGDISYDAIEYEGWELNKDRLVLNNFSDNHFRWVGKPGKEIQIVFETSAKKGNAVLSWNGQQETLHFTKKKNPFVYTFNVPFYASPGWTLFLGILNFTLFSLPFCFLVWKKRMEILQSVNQDFSPGVRKIHPREWIVVLALMSLVFILRALNLEILFPSVEEYSHINAAKQIVQGAPLGSVYQRSLWLVTLPVSVLFRLFGYKLWAARLSGVIFNTLAAIPLYLITRKINKPVAILSLLLFATSPWIVAISRVVREYAYYPFYFFWIIYGMLLFLEQIPDNFRIDRDWRFLLKPKVLLLGFILAIPPYLLIPDLITTFRLILIAYVALGLFLLLKIDIKYWKNLPFLLLALVMMYRYWTRSVVIRPAVNLAPLDYFFLNSPQQWYFDRVAAIPLIGLFGASIVSILLCRKNIVPLFLLTTYVGFLGFFMFSMDRFFAPRHLSTAQLWYTILVAIGLYLFWIFLQTFPLFRESWVRISAIVVLVGMTINFQQVFVPITSHNPSMPITKDYHNDLTELQAFMLANVRKGDVLIASRIYSRYVEWVEKPTFQEIYEFQVQSTEDDVLSVVNQYDSGWIIIDNARIERAVFSPEASFLENDRIEYIGLFDDQHVWRWGNK